MPDKVGRPPRYQLSWAKTDVIGLLSDNLGPLSANVGPRARILSIIVGRELALLSSHYNYSHSKQFIESLPVPVPTGQQRSYIEALVGQLIEMQEALAAARIPHQGITRERQAADLKIQIENEITALFSLSAGDMEIIRAVPAPS